MDGPYLGGGACWSAWVCKGSKRFHLRVQPIWCMWENPQKLVSALLSSPASSPCLKARAILVSQRTWLEERNVFKLTKEIACSPNTEHTWVKRLAESFYNVKYGSSIITSKSSSENLSNHNKHLCFCCLQDKTWIKMPKWTIFRNIITNVCLHYWDFQMNFLT